MKTIPLFNEDTVHLNAEAGPTDLMDHLNRRAMQADAVLTLLTEAGDAATEGAASAARDAVREMNAAANLLFESLKAKPSPKVTPIGRQDAAHTGE